jgi:hypothetical protein
VGERRRPPRARPRVVGYAARGPFEFEITMELDGREVTCTARAPWDARRACEQQLELGRQEEPGRQQKSPAEAEPPPAQAGPG